MLISLPPPPCQHSLCLHWSDNVYCDNNINKRFGDKMPGSKNSKLITQEISVRIWNPNECTLFCCFCRGNYVINNYQTATYVFQK